VNGQANLDGDGRPVGPGGPPSRKGRKVNGWLVVRFIVLVAGAIFVGAGLWLWLVPAGPADTTAKQKTVTTVTDGAGHKQTTTVQKNTEANAPGAGKSDAMLVAVFTVGVGLLAAGGLWDRIREFSFGGVSFRLSEAAAEDPELRIADILAPTVTNLDSAAPMGIADEVRKLPRDLRGARFDLQDGHWWAPENFSFYVLMLAYRSKVKVLVFTGQEGGEAGHYFGAAPVAWLADKVRIADPVVFAAYQATEHMPLTSYENASALGLAFYDKLAEGDLAERAAAAARGDQEPPPRVIPPPNASGPVVSGPSVDQVDRARLSHLAGEALITESIEVDVGEALSRRERLDIVAFPLTYVPITNRRGRLEVVLDKRRIARSMGFSAVGEDY
jgi:hypothetical protein